MKRNLAIAVCLLLISLSSLALAQLPIPSLSAPVTNNAVALLRKHTGAVMFTFMGMGAKKSWDAITNTAFTLGPTDDKWYPIAPVPGTAGRIASSAIAARGAVFVFGGYVMDSQQHAMATPDVNVYQPSGNRWLRGADIPIAVGDSVIGLYRDRYIYLLGGRSNHGAIPNVQIYDSERSNWFPGTPMPGTAVFGHAGAIVEDTIIFVDGAYVSGSGSQAAYATSDQCWLGKIDRHDPGKIEWSRLPPHPGPTRYRIAAGGSAKDQRVYFSGGSAQPYGTLGLGPDGKPLEPSADTFAFNLQTKKWETLAKNPRPTMDHRGLLVTSDGLVVIGGMGKNAEVTNRIAFLSKQIKNP